MEKTQAPSAANRRLLAGAGKTPAPFPPGEGLHRHPLHPGFKDGNGPKSAIFWRQTPFFPPEPTDFGRPDWQAADFQLLPLCHEGKKLSL
jgi:hypothetical protein